MAQEVSFNSRDNPPEGEGWRWVSYQDCWVREIDGRKNRKKKTTKTSKSKTTRKRKMSTSPPPVNKEIPAIELGLLISALMLIYKFFSTL